MLKTQVDTPSGQPFQKLSTISPLTWVIGKPWGKQKCISRSTKSKCYITDIRDKHFEFTCTCRAMFCSHKDGLTCCCSFQYIFYRNCHAEALSRGVWNPWRISLKPDWDVLTTQRVSCKYVFLSERKRLIGIIPCHYPLRHSHCVALMQLFLIASHIFFPGSGWNGAFCACFMSCYCLVFPHPNIGRKQLISEPNWIRESPETLIFRIDFAIIQCVKLIHIELKHPGKSIVAHSTETSNIPAWPKKTPNPS